MFRSNLLSFVGFSRVLYLFRHLLRGQAANPLTSKFGTMCEKGLSYPPQKPEHEEIEPYPPYSV